MALYTEEIADFIWRNGEIIPWAEATIHVNAVGHASVASWTRISDNVLPPGLKCFSNYHNRRLAAMDAVVASYEWPIVLDIPFEQREVAGQDERHPERRIPVLGSER